MYGYDDERAYLVDTAQQGGAVSTSLASLAAARSARGPMSARNRWFTVGLPEPAPDVRDRVPESVAAAIADCAEAFLTPPIANIGNRGILTAAKRVPGWFGRVADPASDLPTIAMLMERAGTGGALFRNVYRDFLSECVGLGLPEDVTRRIAEGRDGYAESARLWTRVAALVDTAGRSGDSEPLTEAGRSLKDIAAIETDAMSTLRSPAS